MDPVSLPFVMNLGGLIGALITALGPIVGVVVGAVMAFKLIHWGLRWAATERAPFSPSVRRVAGKAAAGMDAMEAEAKENYRQERMRARFGRGPLPEGLYRIYDKGRVRYVETAEYERWRGAGGGGSRRRGRYSGPPKFRPSSMPPKEWFGARRQDFSDLEEEEKALARADRREEERW